MQVSEPLAYYERFLSNVETALGIHIVVHDPGGMLHDTDGQPLLPVSRYRHTNPYCDFGRRERNEYNERCFAHCRDAVHLQSLKLKIPSFHQCWKGATEAVVPVVSESQVLLTLFAGPYRAADAEPPASGPSQMLEVWQGLPVADERTLERAAAVLQAVGGRLLTSIERLQQSEASEGESRTAQIRRFIQYNAHRQISLAELARHLCLSGSRARHIVKELFGIPFQELLLHERMARARVLLSTSELPLAMIAERIGFHSEYYFSRAFKKHEGVPPGQFRALYLAGKEPLRLPRKGRQAPPDGRGEQRKKAGEI